MLPFGPFFPDFGSDPDFFQEIVWIWPKMDGLTLKIGLFHHEFNDEKDVLQSWKLREFTKKADEKSDFMVLVRIQGTFRSGFGPDWHKKVVWIWSYFDQS